MTRDPKRDEFMIASAMLMGAEWKSVDKAGATWELIYKKSTGGEIHTVSNHRGEQAEQWLSLMGYWCTSWTSTPYRLVRIHDTPPNPEAAEEAVSAAQGSQGPMGAIRGQCAGTD